QSHQQLQAAARTLIADAAKSPVLSQLRENALPGAPQLDISLHRVEAASMGLSLSDVYATIGMELAPRYVDQMSYEGRIKQVYIQDDAKYRMGPDALHHLYTPSGAASGGSAAPKPAAAASAAAAQGMVPLSSVIATRWSVGPSALQRYDGYPAVEIIGSPGAGYTTGQAMDEVHRLIDTSLPPGYGVEWTGQSYQERLAGDSAPMLMGLSILVVFLALAALYESWSTPVAVLLVVPLGLLGMLGLDMLAGIPNDIFFKIGLVTVIGLAAKNAILIVEFALQAQADGATLFEAVTGAARLRLRPILMTSFAFILGVLPLVLSSGAGAASRHEIGTGVIGGMLCATLFGLLSTAGVITLGDALGYVGGHAQPAKLAAMEAAWRTEAPPAPFNVAAWPRQERQDNLFEIRLPYLLTPLVTHTLSQPVPGAVQIAEANEPRIRDGLHAVRALQALAASPADPGALREFEQHRDNLGFGLLAQRYAPDGDVLRLRDPDIRRAALDSIPDMFAVFWSFRLMVACSLLLLGYFVLALIHTLRDQVQHRRWFLRVAPCM
ncbi:efflux RND transporter permease subunit, partial [Metallibacterium scheffleri]|uniref:efflux RND transporter permease subunit n=1 Tax=Metallibacterium scheffleri TaxID=993689 RepID=UPI0026F02F84